MEGEESGNDTEIEVTTLMAALDKTNIRNMLWDVAQIALDESTIENIIKTMLN